MTTHPTTIRRLTRARAAALAVIAIAATGIVALHVGTSSSSPSVPKGAKAGQLLMHSCTYATEDGRKPADCGTLFVPENRTRSSSRLIALPVTRVRSQTGNRAGPIFYLQGGPGITNMTFPMASRFSATHDVVLLGYRGVDSSTKLDCPEVTSALTGVDDLLSSRTLSAYSNAFRTCAKRLTRDGVDVRGYNSVERVDDFEAARKALGYDRVNLISESAGTRTAMIYAWRYPGSINRSVMLGANPPGRYLYDGATADRQLAQYGALCAADDGCRSRTADLVGTMRSTARDLPERWGPFAIKPGNVKLGSFYGFAHATGRTAPLTGPLTVDTWIRAAHGDASGMWFLSLMADLAIPTSHVWGDMPATGQLDFPAGRAYYAAGGDHGSILGDALGESTWGGGGLLGAWPQSPEVEPYRALRPTDVPTLVISGDLDFATPAEFATKELMPSLRNGRQVILRNLGHTEDTWHYDRAANARLINTYLDSGRVDTTAVPNRAMSFQVGTSHGTTGLIIALSLVGVAGLGLLALVWLPLRQRRRGYVGRTTAVLGRSVIAPLVGFGGFAAAALLALTMWPSLSIGNEQMALVSITAPVVVAVYASWARAAWSRSVLTAGLCSAAAGGAVGAWLGLHAAPSPLGAVLAVLGAVLGANAAVVLRDVIAGTELPDASSPDRLLEDDDVVPDPVVA